MDKMIVTVFDRESSAYEGTRALRELNDEGDIAVYAMAVISRHVDGRVEIKEAADEGALSSAVGMLAGSFVGLLGGPVGLVAGAAGGAMIGAFDDLHRAGVDGQFLADASLLLQPGKSAIVAELAEGWTTPLTTRMQALGGQVLRRRRTDVIEGQIECEIGAYQAELEGLRSEFDQAAGDAKAKVQQAIEQVDAKLARAFEKADQHARKIEDVAKSKIEALESQLTKCSEDFQDKIKRRIDEMRQDCDKRVTKLKKACTLTSEALGV